MIYKTFDKSFFLGKATLLILMLLFSATFLNAQTSTFAQFNERFGTQDFVFTNNIIDANFQTVAGGSPVTFRFFDSVTGLPAGLTGDQEARVFISSRTTASASTTGSTTNQPFDLVFTIRIVRETPFAGRSNLLTAIITTAGASPILSGGQGGFSAAFTASTPLQNIEFTSDFVSFIGSSNRDLSLAFSSIQPSFSLQNSFVSSFTAAGTGTFAADRAPFFMIPTAATVSVSGRVLSPKGRGLANAVITLTGSSGETLTTRTNNFGYYQFTDVVAGDTVIIDVKSKLYAFETQVLNLSEETNGLNFVPLYSKQRVR